MDKEQIKKIINGLPEYDESEEDTARSWIKDFYSKRMTWVMINFYVVCFFLLFPIIISIIKFFRTDQAKYQIMYAALFVVFLLIGYLIKIFGWVWGSRNIISREIKRLELRIAELNETVKNK